MADETLHDVFVSYRWIEPDSTWVRESLVPALRKAGVDVALDVEDFLPGRELITEMTRANLCSRHILCIFSPEYFSPNKMVGFESLMARRLDPNGEGRLIPFILRPVVVPEWLRGLVPVDWTNDAYRQREWRRLLRALGAPFLDAVMPWSLGSTSDQLHRRYSISIPSGVVVLASSGDRPETTISPISVSCGSSSRFSIDVCPDSAQNRELARKAALWVRDYTRQFPGQLQRSIAQRGNRVSFSLGEAAFFPQHLSAGMIVAYLTKILEEMLLVDLSFPWKFPSSSVIPFVGMKFSPDILTPPDVPSQDSLKIDFDRSVTIFCVESVESGCDILRRSGNARLIRITDPIHLAHALLLELLKDLDGWRLGTYLKGSFEKLLETFQACEETLSTLAQYARDQQSQIENMEQEIKLRERQLGWLRERLENTRYLLSISAATATASDLLDEFSALDIASEVPANDGATSANDTITNVLFSVDSAVFEDAEVCRRLFRKLATSYHPDVTPSHPQMFLQLVTHKHDRVWLEVLAAATEPLSPSIWRIDDRLGVLGSTNDDESSSVRRRNLLDQLSSDCDKIVNDLLQHMYRLSDVKRAMIDRIRKKEEEIDEAQKSYSSELNKSVEELATRLSILRYDIDQAWRTLNHLTRRDTKRASAGRSR